MRFARWSWLALLPLSLAACATDGGAADGRTDGGAPARDASRSKPDEDEDDGEGDDQGDRDEGDQDDDVLLELDDLAETTRFASISVRGVGPRDGTVLIESSERGAITGRVDGGGRFCVDVPLAGGTVNVLDVRAIDDQGRYSPKVRVEVEQDGEPPSPAEPPEETRSNVALGAQLTDSVIWDTAGRVSAVVDGNRNTFVEAYFWYELLEDWGELYSAVDTELAFRLEEAADVDRVAVRLHSDDCPDGVISYDVFLSEDANAGLPFDEPTWTLVATEMAIPETDRIESAIRERRAAAVGIRFRTGECPFQNDVFRVYELELFGVEEAPRGEEDPTPTCRSGGG